MTSRRFPSPACVLLLALIPLVALPAPLDHWHWRDPLPTGNPLFGIGANDEQFVAVGDRGTIVVSNNARDWVSATSGTTGTLRAVAWGNGLWVAVGDAGEIVISTNAIDWQTPASGWFYNLQAITWGEGLFVAVGEDTAILTSADGTNWTVRALGSNPLHTVAWGNGRFVAGGSLPSDPPPPFGATPSDNPLILVSEDGLTWRHVPVVGLEGGITCLTFGGDRFVAGTSALGTAISFDGFDWSVGTRLEDWGQGFSFNAVTFTGDRFLATFAATSTRPAGYYAGSDGLGWTFEEWSMPQGPFYGAVTALKASAQGIVGLDSSPLPWMPHLLGSKNGREWWREDRLARFDREASYAGLRFFLRESSDGALESTGTRYLTSRDGQRWDLVEASLSHRFGLPTFGQGRWIAGGVSGRFLVSTNAVNWQEGATGLTNDFAFGAYANQRFILTGPHGALATSALGFEWLSHDLGSTNILGTAVVSNDRIAIPEIGGPGVFVSTNATDWTRQLLPLPFAGIEVLIGWEEGFCALARTNTYGTLQLWRSSDGIGWALDPTAPVGSLGQMLAGGGWLLLLQPNGLIHARRASETTWTRHSLPFPALSSWAFSPASVGWVFGGDTFLIAYYGVGFITQSDPVTDQPPFFDAPPVAVAEDPNSTVTIRAYASGSSPLRYQWRLDGMNIAGATWPHFTVAAEVARSRRITVTVHNPFGTIESEATTLAIAEGALLSLPRPGHLRVLGTPHGRYRIDSTLSLAPNARWEPVNVLEIPSHGNGVLPPLSVFPNSPSQYYRAVFQPE